MEVAEQGGKGRRGGRAVGDWVVGALLPMARVFMLVVKERAAALKRSSSLYLRLTGREVAR